MAQLSSIAPEIPVSNLRESINYYGEKLGFQVVMEMPEGDYAVVERDAVAIHLFRDDALHSPVAMHIFTPQRDELHAELKSRGAHFTQGIVLKPWGNRDFRVNDPSGNEIKFTELSLEE